VIDEDRYTSARNLSTPTKNTDLNNRTAIVPVNVTSIPFQGSIEVVGDLIAFVGDGPIDLNDITNGFDIFVLDRDGKEVNRTVVWDAQALPSRGIEIENNQFIRFTQTGTFFIRARSGNATTGYARHGACGKGTDFDNNSG
jgi:hypothetical protein